MPVDSRITRRLAIACVCVLSLLLCCGLALWQWDRYSSAGGSFQNLGYVLQWPLFGLFPVFVVWRIHQLGKRATEQGEAQAGDTGHVRDPPYRGGQAQRGQARANAAAMPRGARHVDDEPDEELAAYNRYLAELHARDQQGR